MVESWSKNSGMCYVLITNWHNCWQIAINTNFFCWCIMTNVMTVRCFTNCWSTAGVLGLPQHNSVTSNRHTFTFHSVFVGVQILRKINIILANLFWEFFRLRLAQRLRERKIMSSVTHFLNTFLTYVESSSIVTSKQIIINVCLFYARVQVSHALSMSHHTQVAWNRSLHSYCDPLRRIRSIHSSL